MCQVTRGQGEAAHGHIAHPRAGAGAGASPAMIHVLQDIAGDATETVVSPNRIATCRFAMLDAPSAADVQQGSTAQAHQWKHFRRDSGTCLLLVFTKASI